MKSGLCGRKRFGMGGYSLGPDGFGKIRSSADFTLLIACFLHLAIRKVESECNSYAALNRERLLSWNHRHRAIKREIPNYS